MPQEALLEVRQIGVIRSPFKTKEEAPIQPCRSKHIGKVEVFSKYAEGLKDIEQFSHIILVYYFHTIERELLTVKPYLDEKEHGVYATRHPHRPNHIGISAVRLLGRKGNTLTVEEIDAVDGSPLLDIKPYVSTFDIKQGVKNGWLEGKL